MREKANCCLTINTVSFPIGIVVLLVWHAVVVLGGEQRLSNLVQARLREPTRRAESGSVFEALLTLMLSERMGEQLGGQAAAPRAPELEALRAQIQKSLAASVQPVVAPVAEPVGAPTKPLHTNGSSS